MPFLSPNQQRQSTEGIIVVQFDECLNDSYFKTIGRLNVWIASWTYMWHRRRRFRPASSVPSPRNCSPLSQTWAAVKNDDSSASNWQLPNNESFLFSFILLTWCRLHRLLASHTWDWQVSVSSAARASVCLCVWLHRLQLIGFCLLVLFNANIFPFLCTGDDALFPVFLLVVNVGHYCVESDSHYGLLVSSLFNKQTSGEKSHRMLEIIVNR